MKRLIVLVAGMILCAVSGAAFASDQVKLHDKQHPQHPLHPRQQPAATAAISLYDANGQNLGVFVEDDTALVSLSSGYRIVSFQNDGRVWGGDLVYTTPDCSGTPYIEAGWGVAYQRLFRIGEAIYGGKNGEVVSITFCSTKGYDGVCSQDICSNNYTAKAIEVVEITEKLPFTYPVAYPLTIK